MRYNFQLWVGIVIGFTAITFMDTPQKQWRSARVACFRQALAGEDLSWYCPFVIYDARELLNLASKKN
jgi:hypothetical protein